VIDPVGVEVYGGVPTTPRFAVSQGDAAAGGRVFYRPAPIFEAGASFVQVMGEGRIDRQEAGLDARLFTSRTISLAALGLWSTVEGRLAEASLRATWQPVRALELNLDGARTAPDLLLPRGSIFSVFADETHDELGGGVYWRPLPRLRLYADGHAISDDGGTGGRAGARATLALGRDNATTLGTEFRAIELPQKGLLDARAFATQRFSERVVATLDADAAWLDPAVNMQTTSITAAATLGWDFRPGWKALITGIAGETPLLDRRIEAMAKLVYGATLHVREARP
jgi:hypothetical protein